jgi:hypothetical protein
MDATDASNQTIRDASDNFMFQLKTHQDAEDAANAFADKLESHIRGLEALVTAPAFYGDLLVCLLIDKLAIDVGRNLTRQQGTLDWTLDELRTAIKLEIEIMEDTYEHPPSRPALKQVNFPPTQPSKPFTGRPCPFFTGDPTHCTEFKGS